MSNVIGIGWDCFDDVKKRKLFFIDKTGVIREWWESPDDLTLMTRPRQFGRTLSLSMFKCFFSTQYQGRSDLFEGFEIWQDEKFQKLQGTFPVINMSFGMLKRDNFDSFLNTMCYIVGSEFGEYRDIIQSSHISQECREKWREVYKELSPDKTELLGQSIRILSQSLFEAEGKKVIILLDEYDAPLKKALCYDYWDEMSGFMRSFLTNTFKDNPYLEKALIMGVSSISMEKMLPDTKIFTASVYTEKYKTAMGFTEEEVSAAMQEYGVPHTEEVKAMYGGFAFGSQRDIYNPWSIINYIKSKGDFEEWWLFSSSNEEVKKIIEDGELNVRSSFFNLLFGYPITTQVYESIDFDHLEKSPATIWSLLIQAGYLQIVSKKGKQCELNFPNREGYRTLEEFSRIWFNESTPYTGESFDDFFESLKYAALPEMNAFVRKAAKQSLHKYGSEKAKDFYYGFLLQLIRELKYNCRLQLHKRSEAKGYAISFYFSNEPWSSGFIIEFLMLDEQEDKDLIQAIETGLSHIEANHYDRKLLEDGILAKNIHKYVFAFSGQEVLIDDEKGEMRNAYRRLRASREEEQGESDGSEEREKISPLREGLML